MSNKNFHGIILGLLALALFGAGCLPDAETVANKSAQGEGMGDLKIEWRTNWTPGLLKTHNFTLDFINHEQTALSGCQLSLDGTANDIKDILFRVALSGSSNVFTETVEKVEPEVLYRVGDNEKYSSFTSKSNMPDLSKPPQKVKLECGGKSSEWQINYK